MSFPTKTRACPLALFKQFVTLTGRKIRFLRIDSAKEFQSEEIRQYCADNDVVLQLLVAYNHTMQAVGRVHLVASNGTAEHLCYTQISQLVSGMTRPKISV